MGLEGRGCGLQVLSVTLKSDHLMFRGFNFSSISGMYSSGSVAALHEASSLKSCIHLPFCLEPDLLCADTWNQCPLQRQHEPIFAVDASELG